MFHRGQFVIFCIFVLAIAASVFAVWHHHWQGRRAMMLWEIESATLIERARQVELLLLASQDDPTGPGEELDIGGRTMLVTGRKDVSRAGGMVHARHALLVDASFDWEAPRDENLAARTRWEYALRFSEAGQTATVALDLSSGRARLLERGKEASIAPIADGMRKFIEQQLPPSKQAGGG